MVPAGSISHAANNLRILLVDNINDFSDISRVKIGHPAKTLKDSEHGGSENFLNLFFYHVDYSGYPADVTPENPFYVRIYCLITAVGDSNTPDTVSQGENELRLIGEVMRVFHENPIISIGTGEGSSFVEIATLQIVPHALTLDSLNHVWGTQGSETPYRLSVAYEMSLAPIPLALPMESSPRIGEALMHSWGSMHRDQTKASDGQQSLIPACEYTEVDTTVEDWIPHIAYVEGFGQPDASLHYIHMLDASTTDPIHILVAGKEGGEVKLFWHFWIRKDDNSVQAWSQDVPDASTASTTIHTASDANRIDPEMIDAHRVIRAGLPVDIKAFDVKTWQATLYATREWSHERPAGSGQSITTTIQSNSLLFHGGGAP